MMENAQDSKKRVKHADRVTLTPEALTRLSDLMDDLQGELKGCRVTKSDLASYLLASLPIRLSDRQKAELKDLHFDKVRFAQWAVRQLKTAKAQGKTLSLEDLMKEGKETAVKLK